MAMHTIGTPMIYCALDLQTCLRGRSSGDMFVTLLAMLLYVLVAFS